MKYGLPYKGSKNKLAERIVRFLPKRDNLVDLFCGGCAVSHAALLMGKYRHIHINDLNWMCPTLFIDALNGKYNDDTRWISREDFFRLRDTDPYVAVVWSFGNNLRDYLYSQEIEPLKRAIHYAIFFSDYEPGRELGHDLSFVDGIGDVQRRYIAVKRYFSQFCHFQQQSFEGGADASRAPYSDNAAQPYAGGQALRLQHAEAFSRLNTNLQSYGGGQARQPDWRQPKDGSISLGISPVGANHGGGCSVGNKRPAELQHQECRRQPVFQKKKLQATLGSRTPGANQQRCTDCSTGSGNTPCQPVGGGKHCPSRAVCLTMPRWRYPRAA